MAMYKYMHKCDVEGCSGNTCKSIWYAMVLPTASRNDVNRFRNKVYKQHKAQRHSHNDNRSATPIYTVIEQIGMIVTLSLS